MAITIEQMPASAVTAYNPINYVLSSNNSNNDGFKYLIQLYVEGALKHTYAIPPEPVTGFEYGVVDLSRVVETFVEFDFDTAISDSDVKNNPNSIAGFQAVFGEQYEVSGVITNFSGLVSGTSKTALNASLNFLDFIDFDFTDYYNDNTNATLFLTNAPRGRTIMSDQNAWLYMFDNPNETNLDKFQIRTFNSLGVQNGNFRIDNPYSQSMATSGSHVRIPAGININGLSSGLITVTSGALPILDADVYSYTVTGLNASNVGTTESYRYFRDFGCTKYGGITLHFLNQLGGFDSHMFSMVSVKSWDKTAKTYKTKAYDLSAAGSVTYSKSKHQIRQYFTKTNEKYVLNSNWITEDESIWLRELFDSPVVYAEIGGENIACTVELNNYTEKKRVNDRLFNLSVTISFGFDNYRQRW